VSINATRQHYYIFNSSYYGLTLSKATIGTLYDKYRCPLLNNSALALDGSTLFEGNPSEDPFPIHDRLVHVNVRALFRVSQNAVQTFIGEVDKIVPGSEQEQNLLRKR